MKFLTGLIVGIALCAILYALTRPVVAPTLAPSLEPATTLPAAISVNPFASIEHPISSSRPSAPDSTSQTHEDPAPPSTSGFTADIPSPKPFEPGNSVSAPPTPPTPRENEPALQETQNLQLLSEGHGKILEKDRERPDNIGQFYDDFMAEKRDTGWAYRTEQHLHGFFDRVPPQYGYSVSSIECRSSLCMLQITGNRRTVSARWITILSQYFEQPYQVGGGRWGISSAAEQFYILQFFTRQ